MSSNPSANYPWQIWGKDSQDPYPYMSCLFCFATEAEAKEELVRAKEMGFVNLEIRKAE